MKKIKINKNNGILFFITGLSGAGKTSTSLKIRKYIIKSFGPTVIIHSEKIRKIYPSITEDRLIKKLEKLIKGLNI